MFLQIILEVELSLLIEIKFKTDTRALMIIYNCEDHVEESGLYNANHTPISQPQGAKQKRHHNIHKTKVQTPVTTQKGLFEPLQYATCSHVIAIATSMRGAVA